jgi:predicted MFS family arabinose efflux permease
MDSSLARSVTATDVEGIHNRPRDHEDPEKQVARTTTNASHTSTATRRVLSRFRTADSLPLTPPPDGGVQAWTMALMACLVNINTWGFVNSFGLFQTYYVNVMGIGEPSAVSWIGSVGIFLTFAIGTFSGRATDAGYFHVTFWTGSLIYCVGLLALSFCDQYWSIFVCHALIVGFGSGLAFVPSLTIAASYFSHAKRSMALALVVCGSSTGGLVFPAVAEQMLPTHGFGWTMRTIFFVQTALAIVTCVLFKPRVPPRRSGPLVEWPALQEAPYTFYLIASFFSFLGVYVGFFYVGSFSRDILRAPQSTGIQLLLTMNGVGLIARVVPNFVAEKVTGPLNLIIPYSVVVGVVFFSWIAVTSVSSLWAWAVMYGIMTAGPQALFPVVLTSLTDDPKKMGVRSGMGFTMAGFAVLVGPPIAGAIVERMDGSYLGLQIFSGLTLMMAACFQVAARIAKVGLDFKAKL